MQAPASQQSDHRVGAGFQWPTKFDHVLTAPAKPWMTICIITPFDFALDREMWRWVPNPCNIEVTRTPFSALVGGARAPDAVEPVNATTLRKLTRNVSMQGADVVAYSSAAATFQGDIRTEQETCLAISTAWDDIKENERPEIPTFPSVTTAGALVRAAKLLRVRRIAIVSPLPEQYTNSIASFLKGAGIAVVSTVHMPPGRPSQATNRDGDVRAAIRQADTEQAQAVFVASTNLPTFGVIPEMENALKKPVLSANQVTICDAVQHIPEQHLQPSEHSNDQMLVQAMLGTGLYASAGHGAYM